MPIQADIKEKNASRSGSLISMAFAFVIHMSGAVMTYMPIGNNGTEGQHKEKEGKDPEAAVLGGSHAGWDAQSPLKSGGVTGSMGCCSPINENLVETPA